MTALHGRCHCGAVKLLFETGKDPAAPAAPRDFHAEDATARCARRRGMWTPLVATALA